jgi:uncharacterized protein DUF6609
MYPYPLIRGGGLFLTIIGAMIIAGALLPRARAMLVAAGLALAGIVTALAAPSLARPLGVPSWQQILVLAGSVLLEIVLIQVVVRYVYHLGERAIILSVLLVVGLHFLPMAVAFGPIVAILGMLTILNAGVGLWLRPKMNLSVIWFLDGLLKFVCGIIMMVLVRT